MRRIVRNYFWIPLLAGSMFASAYLFYRTNRVETSQSQEIKKTYAKDSTFILDDLSDLPLLKFENDTAHKDYFVLMFSGDGGWRGFVNTCAKTISDKGVNVVGFNALPYFDSLRSPQKIAADLERVVHNFSHVWKKKSVILGGYSFTAEILPFVYNNFSPEVKKQVNKIFMIGPSKGADFKANRLYYYNKSKSAPVLPEFEKGDPEKYIIFCDDQAESLCNVLPSTSPAKLIPLDAGHLFIGKSKEVSVIIANAVVK
jgi:type IV secretory pathway VirJ component